MSLRKSLTLWERVLAPGEAWLEEMISRSRSEFLIVLSSRVSWSWMWIWLEMRTIRTRVAGKLRMRASLSRRRGKCFIEIKTNEWRMVSRLS